MDSEKQSKLGLFKRKLVPRRPSVLIGRKGKASKGGTNVEHAIRAATLRLTASAPAPSDALQRYRRGEITEAEYLRERVEYATSHLKGRVSSERLQMIKEVVAEKLETDPALIEARARLLEVGGGTGG